MNPAMIFGLAKLGLEVAEKLAGSFGKRKLTVGGVEIDLDGVDVKSFKDKVAAAGTDEDELAAMDAHLAAREGGGA